MANRQLNAAKADLKKQLKVAAGLVSERFPDVADITIQMTYFRKGTNPVLMLRTVNMFPYTHAYFNMDCVINGCTDGGFDLTPVITEMIKKRQKTKKGSLACCGRSSELAPDHAYISYEVNVQFAKKS